MMNPVYIRATGIHTEQYQDLNALNAAFLAPPKQIDLSDVDIYQAANLKLNQLERQAIAREDRSILNDLATSILNASGDMLSHANKLAGLDNAEATPLYAGTDGVAEYSFSALSKLIDRFGDANTAMKNLGILSGMTNPINMMRFLSTNPLYHASKRMGLRGGGYPIRGMSLSGLYAIEDAMSDIAANRAQQGVVVAAASMRNFDSLVIFGKLGLLDPQSEAGTVNPSYGSAVLLLDNLTEGDNALAQVLRVSSRYNAAPFPSEQDWTSLLQDVAVNGITPDVIVTYCNGVKSNDANELAAIESVFPNTPQHNYKSLFGYTSKANNALDLVTALSDPAIPTGATVLINGAGFGVGIGYIVIKKLRHNSLPMNPSTLEAQ